MLLKLKGVYATEEYSHSIIDEEDYEKIITFYPNWYANPKTDKNGNIRIDKNGKLYVCAVTYFDRKTYFLHRVIMEAINPQIYVDHINHNPLDNRKENLRFVNSQQSAMNRRGKSSSTSKYNGVSYCVSRKNYQVSIKYNNKCITIGRFKNEVDAAIAYDKAALNFFGEYASLNFPENIQLYN